MKKMLIFTDAPPTPSKVYGLYTRGNVDIYGWPLMQGNIMLSLPDFFHPLNICPPPSGNNNDHLRLMNTIF